VAKETEEKVVMRPSFADRLNAALESTRQTVTNLNEALVAKKKTLGKSTPTEAAPAPACPDEGKSA
jgi:hypothetical protein